MLYDKLAPPAPPEPPIPEVDPKPVEYPKPNPEPELPPKLEPSPEEFAAGKAPVRAYNNGVVAGPVEAAKLVADNETDSSFDLPNTSAFFSASL